MKIQIIALRVYEGEPPVFRRIAIIKNYNEEEVFDLMADYDIFESEEWRKILNAVKINEKPLPSHTPNGQRIAYIVTMFGYKKGMDERVDSTRKGGSRVGLFPGWDWQTKQKRNTIDVGTLSKHPLPPYYFR